MSAFFRRHKRKGLLALLLLLRERAKETVPLLALLVALSALFLGPNGMVISSLDAFGRRLGLRGSFMPLSVSGGLAGLARMLDANRPSGPPRAAGLFAPGEEGFRRYGSSSVGLVAGGRALRRVPRRPGTGSQGRAEGAEGAAKGAVGDRVGGASEGGGEAGAYDWVAGEHGKTVGGIVRPREAREYEDGVALSEEEMEAGLAQKLLGVGKRFGGLFGAGDGPAAGAGPRDADGRRPGRLGQDGEWRGWSGPGEAGGGGGSSAMLLASVAQQGGNNASSSDPGRAARAGDPAFLRDAVAPWAAGAGGLPSGAVDRLPPAALGGPAGAFRPRAADRGSDMMRAAFGSTRFPSASGGPGQRAGPGLGGDLGRLAWDHRASNVYQAGTASLASQAGMNTVMYQLAETRAYGVAAAPPPGHCAPGACPAEFAANTGGVTFDGGRLWGNVIVSDEFGDPGVHIPDQAGIDTLIQQAQRAEEDALRCEQAEADYGAQERAHMERIQQLSDQLNALGCGSGGCSKSKYKRCMAVGDQMRATCRAYNDVAARKAAACPLMTDGYSAMDCSK